MNLARICAALAAVIAAATPTASATSYPKPPVPVARAIAAAFPPAARPTATCLAYAETRYDTERRVRGSSWSASGDHGLFSVNYVAHHRPGETEAAFHSRMASLAANAREAARISGGGRSWAAWTGTYGRGLCHGI